MNEEPQKPANNSILIVVIVVLVIIIIAAIIIFSLIGFLSKDDSSNVVAPTIAPTQTSTVKPTQTPLAVPDEDTPSDVVMMYLTSTLGTIPGSNVDYDDAKNYVSAELVAQMDDPMFFPTSYCIQDGPTDVKIDTEFIDDTNMESDVTVSAQYGDTYDKMWQFYLVNGVDGWKIKSITCLQTDQVTQ